MNRYLLPLSVLGTAVGGAVLLRDYVAGGVCPSKATIPGKTVIVTGANTGIGKQTALELARRGGNIILACRDMEKCEAAAKDIRGETLNHRVSARHLDLASLKSIREFAAKIIEGKVCSVGLLLCRKTNSSGPRADKTQRPRGGTSAHSGQQCSCDAVPPLDHRRWL